MKKQSKKSKQTVIESKNEIVLRPRSRAEVFFRLSGISPLIQNRFSQKAIEEMLKKHMGHKTQKEAKKPAEVIARAIVYNENDVVCMPATAFMKACLSVVKTKVIKGLDGNKLKFGFRVIGEAIPIEYAKMVPRMDMVRNANGMPDVRFRPEFVGWSCRLGIEYDDNVFSLETIVDILGRAGSGVGVGEWRPERLGVFGRFEITDSFWDSKEIGEVRAACSVPLKRAQIPEWALNADIDMQALAAMLSPSGDGEPGSEGKAA